VPKAWRLPKFSKATRPQMPPAWRFYDNDRLYWKGALRRQPACSKALWKQLIGLREERIAGMVAGLKLFHWIESHTHAATAGTP